MRGTYRKISLPRRLIGDLMHASMDVPRVSVRRTLHIGPLVKARAAQVQRPGWSTIIAKAYAIAARNDPTFRTLYVKWPWPHFYEVPRSVAMVAIVRNDFDEQAVHFLKIGEPDAEGVGEVLIKGEMVFDGYYRNPQATADAFTEDGWFRSGDLGRIDVAGLATVAHNVSLDQYTSWTRGTLTFYNTPLRDVVQEMNRWYDVTIVLGDSSLASATMTGTLPIHSAREAIGDIAAAQHLRSVRHGQVVTLLPAER